MRKPGLTFLILVVLCTGCKHSQTTPPEQPSIVSLGSKVGVIIERRSFPEKSFTLPKPQPDEVTGSLTSVWTPANLGITSIELRDVSNSGKFLKGVVIRLDDSYWTVSGGGETRHGDHTTNSSTLDEDDAKSVDGAVTAMKQTAQQWTQKAPDEETVQWFEAKGGLLSHSETR